MEMEAARLEPSCGPAGAAACVSDCVWGEKGVLGGGGDQLIGRSLGNKKTFQCSMMLRLYLQQYLAVVDKVEQRDTLVTNRWPLEGVDWLSHQRDTV